MMQVGITITFNLALVHTSAAMALILFSLNPVWSALLGRAVLGERLRWRTHVANLMSLVAIGIICLPSLFGQAGEATQNSDEGDRMSLRGNLFALAASLFLAGFVTNSRHASLHAPDTDMASAVALGTLLTTFLALRNGVVSPAEAGFSGPAWQVWLTLVASGLGGGIYFICVCIAPALISGTEVGLIAFLEVILGPLFTFLAFGDKPSLVTLVGGSVLIATLVTHELAAFLYRDIVDETRRQEQTPDLKASSTSEVSDDCTVADV